jgi:hypothetical protein
MKTSEQKNDERKRNLHSLVTMDTSLSRAVSNKTITIFCILIKLAKDSL